MEDNLLLSIIIPYYNSDEWIGHMLDSLFDQDLAENTYEIIVVDDGSSQDPLTLKQYSEKYQCIKYLRKANGGVSSARNAGIELANGKWVYFCDSDDFLQPNVLGYVLKTAEDLDLEMLICNWTIAYPGENSWAHTIPKQTPCVVSGIEYLASFATTNPMSIGFGLWRFIIKRGIILENCIRFENLSYVEDRIFQLDLLLAVNRLAYIDVNLYYYVQHPTSIMHEQKRTRFEQYASWIWRYIERITEATHNKAILAFPDAITTLNGWIDMAVFSLLINSLKYCPVSTSKYYLTRLPQLEGAYPIAIKGRSGTRLIRKCMGHKKLWLALCRLFHLLPYRVRLHF